MPILVISRSKVLQLLGVEEQIKQATNDFTFGESITGQRVQLEAPDAIIYTL
ncbi:hypothetical protein BDW60DRAFT_189476, partial [Aspergillus nidulans var. acristatus]